MRLPTKNELEQWAEDKGEGPVSQSWLIEGAQYIIDMIEKGENDGWILPEAYKHVRIIELPQREGDTIHIPEVIKTRKVY